MKSYEVFALVVGKLYFFPSQSVLSLLQFLKKNIYIQPFIQKMENTKQLTINQ